MHMLSHYPVSHIMTPISYLHSVRRMSGTFYILDQKSIKVLNNEVAKMCPSALSGVRNPVKVSCVHSKQFQDFATRCDV